MATNPSCSRSDVKRLTLLASLLVGCGPSIWVSGTVKAPPGPGCAASAIELRHVAGANVELVCPKDKNTATTSERGQFFFVSHEAFSADCRVRVTKAGFTMREYRVGDVCAFVTPAGCEQATVAVDLTAEAAR